MGQAGLKFRFKINYNHLNEKIQRYFIFYIIGEFEKNIIKLPQKPQIV
ncbi:hypothetical protein pb186bvf_019935 [Paramecium bursaria]